MTVGISRYKKCVMLSRVTGVSRRPGDSWGKEQVRLGVYSVLDKQGGSSTNQDKILERI